MSAADSSTVLLPFHISAHVGLTRHTLFMFQANLTEVLLEYFPLVICVLKIQCECKLKCVQVLKRPLSWWHWRWHNSHNLHFIVKWLYKQNFGIWPQSSFMFSGHRLNFHIHILSVSAFYSNRFNHEKVDNSILISGCKLLNWKTGRRGRHLVVRGCYWMHFLLINIFFSSLHFKPACT